jgi:hypothetical protein
MSTETKTVQQEFAEFVEKNGPAFIHGDITAPYSGCMFLNGVAFIDGDKGYIAAEISQYPRYKRYSAATPARKVKVLHSYTTLDRIDAVAGGCIDADDIDNVMDSLEFHPISELAENTPHSRVAAVILIAKALGYNINGQFKCACCGTDLADGVEIDGTGVYYLESEFRGNGGIGIEVGAPICGDCYSARRCGYCGEEAEPEGICIDEEGHCIWCAPAIDCKACGESFRPSDGAWREQEKAVKAYQEGKCLDCA